MAWKNLKREISEEFEGLANAERVVKAGLRKSAGSMQARREERDRDNAIPETPAQRLLRKRLARAAHVEALARGQEPAEGRNAAYQRRYMEMLHKHGLPRFEHKHANPQLAGKGPRRKFEPTPAQQKLIDDRSISADVLAIKLQVSRVTAFRLRRKALTGKAR